MSFNYAKQSTHVLWSLNFVVNMNTKYLDPAKIV